MCVQASPYSKLSITHVHCAMTWCPEILITLTLSVSLPESVPPQLTHCPCEADQKMRARDGVSLGLAELNGLLKI